MIKDRKTLLMMEARNDSQGGEIIVCDFRKMTRFQEGRKGTVTRLQDGPRERRTKEEFRRTTGIILRKLVTSLTEMIPEIQMEKAGRKFTRHTRRQETATNSTASHVEESKPGSGHNR